MELLEVVVVVVVLLLLIIPGIPIGCIIPPIMGYYIGIIPGCIIPGIPPII
jgi:hypothetical protein